MPDWLDRLRNWGAQPLDRRAEQAQQYQGIDQSNYMLPGYDQREQALQQFLNGQQYGSQQAVQGQRDLAGLLMRQAQGQDSLSAEQLRQSYGNLQAQQQGMAAGASPSNQGLALRAAMQNMSQLGGGLAGQQALAGIAERNAAAQAAGGVLGQARGQDISSFMGAQGLGLEQAGMQQQGGMGYEANRFGRFQTAMGTPSNKTGLINALSSALPMLSQMGGGGGGGASSGLTQNGPGSDIARSFLSSDVRLKQNIRPLKPEMDAALIGNYGVGATRQRPGGSVAPLAEDQVRRFVETPTAEDAMAQARSLKPEMDAALIGNYKVGATQARPGGSVAPLAEGQVRRFVETPTSEDMVQALARIPSYQFEYKPGMGLPPGERTGQMAQDIEMVAPGAVTDTPQGKMVDYQALTPAILALVQRQQAEIDALKGKKQVSRRDKEGMGR